MWPERYTITGLTYERFDTPQGRPPTPIWDQTARSAWLRRQTTFDSGPYEQAARVYRQYGYSREAEQILIAQRRDARRTGRPATTWPRRGIEAIYATVGYGYRPSRVLWILAVLLVLVAASLELPASQATLRATNGNGDVYATSGLLTMSAGATAPNSAQQGHWAEAPYLAVAADLRPVSHPVVPKLLTGRPAFPFDQFAGNEGRTKRHEP